MGYHLPRSLAAMRGIKAEGGWGVVCTEETEIHHSSDLSPNIEGRIWDDGDIPALELVTTAIHEHGALAGIELTYGGYHASNLYSRTPALSPRSLRGGYIPWQARRMDLEDIRDVRRWHKQAARRAQKAGFDLIYCYAGHNLSLAMHFLLSRYNDRTDEYGGSLENRVRFLRELIEDTKDAVGDTCAVAVRLGLEELLGEDGLDHQGEGYDILAMLAELPDLWDVNLSPWEFDSGSSRFDKEGFQENYIASVKTLTSKPVVGVGRYTTPETMVSAVRRGLVDLVGAARPSIADPFLPQKVRLGRIRDIRECIGCNICASADQAFVPIRCTQNPTMGEEWRRGWHPELIAPKKREVEVLVIGGGPAGLECARALGQRGYRVVLTEARREFGGRVALESHLPGLSEWRRVVDWRMAQIEALPNVSLYPGSLMAAGDVVESGIRDVILGTGATWRGDGIGTSHWQSIPGHDLPSVFNPGDLMSGEYPPGQVVLFDDDHYYMGAVLAELLVGLGCEVVLATPAPQISAWSYYTLEQQRTQDRLVKLGIKLYTSHTLESIHPGSVGLAYLVTGHRFQFPCDSVVLVTDRNPNNQLYQDLKPALADGRLDSLRLIGDADAPHLIAQAVFAGHLAARQFDEPPTDGTPFLREFTSLMEP
jgi:dimethylamine/trimethylamine dehydrogenase